MSKPIKNMIVNEYKRRFDGVDSALIIDIRGIDAIENNDLRVDLLNKDIRLAVEMAKAYDAPPLLSRTVEHINEMARAQGYGSKDTSVMWKCFGAMWDKK